MSTPPRPGDNAKRPDGWQPGQATHTGMPATTGPAGAPSPTRPIVIGATTGPAPTRNTSKRTLTIVVAVLLALVVIDVMLTASLLRALVEGRDGQAARETVEAYLTAVAEADAEKARGYLGEVDDDSLLTDEVLKVSNERAPLTGITVGRVIRTRLIDDAYHVQVSYTIGDEEVSTVVRVETTGGLVITSVSWLWLTGVEDVDFTVNGAVPDTDEPNVFPGSYELAASNEYLEITGEPIAATEPSIAPYGPSVENELVVSEAGVQMFREKVVAEATECLASTSLDPGCGIKAIPQYPDSVPGCEEIQEGTVHREQDADQAARLESVTPEPAPFGEEPTIIGILFTELGRFTLTVTCRTGDTWTSREINDYGQLQGLFFGSPTIALTDPELPVVWDR
ncbi:hypothetical protein [Propionibacterium australiense]|uniref:DUF4878 domain-containing protein n=1 Tax=Propionibacterium australiense TaxID=119981 RepID=A0A383S980_9ACTN|nr:hypothetical protein [Propionibacterium australiense]RLP07499.1 hypothetical protein D9T14_10295 [Propionibacterium australiense]SYZ34102.1 Hypothetical protein PROPAUS_2104 [Propionibacterium australiense]VEH88691.1 Uncharacterised protein [Propionibacterium australiense]